MSEYRKKPVVIEAYSILGNEEPPTWLHAAFGDGTIKVEDDGAMLIETLEGVMRAAPGDWIIKGVKGEFYPCKADIFQATYEPAAPSPYERLEEWIAETNERAAQPAPQIDPAQRLTPEAISAIAPDELAAMFNGCMEMLSMRFKTAQELYNEVVLRATQSNAWGGLGSFFFEKHAADTLLEVASEWGLSDPQELPSE